jgi:hypothetical protein
VVKVVGSETFALTPFADTPENQRPVILDIRVSQNNPGGDEEKIIRDKEMEKRFHFPEDPLNRR